MTEPSSQERSVVRRGVEWLVAPNLSPGLGLQISNFIDTEDLTPEALESLAKFMKELQLAAKPQPPVDPCPMLTLCVGYKTKVPCTVLATCTDFNNKVITF